MPPAFLNHLPICKHPSSGFYRAASGYTFVEVITALVLTVLLASLMLPGAINHVGERKLLSMAEHAMTEINLAYAMYAKDNVPDNATNAANFIYNTNYIRTITDSSHWIQVEDATANCDSTNSFGECTSLCTALKPCLVLQDGGLLQFDPAASFNGATPMNIPAQNYYAIKFLYDPDGRVITQTATSIYLFYGGRISTEMWSQDITTNDTVLPDDAVAGSDGNAYINDPEYLRDLSDG